MPSIPIPQASKIRWVSHTHWSCDRHVPSSLIPARIDSCWYFGCPSTRPSEEDRPSEIAVMAVAPPPPPPPPAPPIPGPPPVLVLVKPEPQRPPKPSMSDLREAAARKREAAYHALIDAALKEYQRPAPIEDEPSPPPVEVLTHKAPPIPEAPIDPDQPSAREKKRGATLKKSCDVCGCAVWRRPSEADRKMYLCPLHRSKDTSK